MHFNQIRPIHTCARIKLIAKSILLKRTKMINCQFFSLQNCWLTSSELRCWHTFSCVWYFAIQIVLNVISFCFADFILCTKCPKRRRYLKIKKSTWLHIQCHSHHLKKNSYVRCWLSLRAIDGIGSTFQSLHCSLRFGRSIFIPDMKRCRKYYVALEKIHFLLNRF